MAEFANVDDIPVEDAFLLYRAGMLWIDSPYMRVVSGGVPWMNAERFDSWWFATKSLSSKFVQLEH